MTQVNPTPEPRRLSLPGRFTSLPDLSHSPNLQIPTPSSVNGRSPTSPRKFEKIVTDERKFETEENDDELSSTCSTPTLMEIKNMKKVRIDLLDIYLCLHLQEAGYESDSTVFQESDCEGIIDEILTTENEDKESYKAFNANIMEISDIESEDDDPEERTRRIEQMAAAMNVMNNESSFKRGELNMDIDTLSERSEEESDREQRQPKQRSRRQSGRKRSMSRERNVAKIR